MKPHAIALVASIVLLILGELAIPVFGGKWVDLTKIAPASQIIFLYCTIYGGYGFAFFVGGLLKK